MWSPLVGQELAVHDNHDTVATRVGLALNIEAEVDRAHDAIAELLERIEPPTDGRLATIVSDGLRVAERAWFTAISASLTAEGRGKILALVDWREGSGADDQAQTGLQDAAEELEQDPGSRSWR